MILFRPTGEAEIKLVAQSGWTAWPPRLPEQPIFYPVTNQPYAEQIARDWNSTQAAPNNLGFVTRFEISDDVAARYPVQRAGGNQHTELWVPAEDMDLINNALVGAIELIGAFRDGNPWPLAQAHLHLEPA